MTIESKQHAFAILALCTALQLVPSAAQAQGIANRVAELEAKVAALEALLQGITRETVNGQPTVRFSGVNVQVVNGLNSTGTVNGTGNLIVGYDEADTSGRLRCTLGTAEDGTQLNVDNCEAYGGTLSTTGFKTGSHYLVVGSQHNYSSAPGVLFGFRNTSNFHDANVLGGGNNTASGLGSSVTGGQRNTASGGSASVSGGRNNTASGRQASVSGGTANTASGQSSWASGGGGNVASGLGASVSGGGDNVADGEDASISGGQLNIATEKWSSVNGGSNNAASGVFSSISGGQGCDTGPDTNKWKVGSPLEAGGCVLEN